MEKDQDVEWREVGGTGECRKVNLYYTATLFAAIFIHFQLSAG